MTKTSLRCTSSSQIKTVNLIIRLTAVYLIFIYLHNLRISLGLINLIQLKSYNTYSFFVAMNNTIVGIFNTTKNNMLAKNAPKLN